MVQVVVSEVHMRRHRTRFRYATAYSAYASHTLPHTSQVVVSEVYTLTAFF